MRTHNICFEENLGKLSMNCNQILVLNKCSENEFHKKRNVMNMTFISSRVKVKKNVYLFLALPLMKYTFFSTSLGQIKIILTTKN